MRVLNRIPNCSIVTPQSKSEMLERYHAIESKRSIPAYAALFDILELLSSKEAIPGSCDIVPTQEVSFIPIPFRSLYFEEPVPRSGSRTWQRSQLRSIKYSSA